MSWSIFKQEMKAKMVNSSFKSTNEFADFFTQKYDQCMKRGLDVTTQNTVIKGNTELMRATILYALQVGVNSKTPAFYNQSIALLGKGAVAYWTGAELGKIPPLIPAPGTILNLSVVTNTATNPGTWPPAPFPVFPSTSNDPYLDAFILQATIHLQTVSGFCNTISQYPPTAPPGPGILPWVGFNVAVAPATPPSTTNAEETLPNQPRTLTAADFIIDITEEEELAREYQVANDALIEMQSSRIIIPALEIEVLKEFTEFTGRKLLTKQNVSIDAVDSDINKESNLQPAVARIIAAAKNDLNIRENLGANDSIRIREMLINVGYLKPASWCAAAVTSWWNSAGVRTPAFGAPRGKDSSPMPAAGCKEWEKWARKNKLFSNTPVVGGAILYGPASGGAHHMGIVESYNKKTGVLTVIEGNTVPKRVSRNGGGCYRKTTLASRSDIIGYVIPQPK